MTFLGFEDPSDANVTFATDKDLGRGSSFVASLGEIYARNNAGLAQDTVGKGAYDDAASGRVGKLYNAAVDQALYVENGLARSEALEEATRRRIRAIADVTGVTLENPEGDGYRREARARTRGFVNEQLRGNAEAMQAGGLVEQQRQVLSEKLAELEKSFPQHAAVIRANVPLQDDARALAGEAEKTFDTAAGAMKNAPLGLAAGFGGGAVGFVQDPINAGTMFLGAGPSAAKGVLGRLASRTLQEMFYNAGATAIAQPEVQAWRKEIGARNGLAPALENVGFAALFGGAFGLAFGGVAELLPKTKRPLTPADVPALERVLSGEATPAQVRDVLDLYGVTIDKTELEAATRQAAADGEIPAAPSNISPAEHADAINDALRHAEDPAAAPPPAPPIPIPRADPARPVLADGAPVTVGDAFAYDGKPVARETFDPRELETDAGTFQYKGGGDDDGVTTRLRSVRKWDPLAAGNVIVFERADGTRVVADGHQRAGLARRLASQGDENAKQVGGFLFREADGWTPADVRAIAAKKNIQEGSGGMLDTARILRDRPDLWDETLPISDDRLTKARALSQLSDDAWGAVVNGVIDPLYASHIAAMAPDPHWHAALVKEIVDGDPPNEAAARFMIADALSAGLAHDVQETMFGLLETAASLRRERSQVFDTARKMLSQEKRIFATLEAQADRIEAGGNTLSRETNKERARSAGELVQLIEKLATRAGPVSDALNRAARAMKEGQARNRVAATFVADLVDVIDREGFAGLLAEPKLAPATVIEPGSAEAIAQGDQVLDDLTLSMFGDETPPGASPAAAEGAPGSQVAETAGKASQRPRQEIATPAEVLDTFKEGQAGVPFEELYARAEQLHGELAQAGDAIALATGATFKDPGVKDKAAAFGKIARKSYEGPHELTDMARGGFIVETADQAEAVALELGRRFDVLDEGWKATDLGYTDRKILVRGSDGTIAEVQIIPAPMQQAKGAKGGSKFYSRSRELPRGSAERVQLETWQKELYAAAASELDETWSSVIGSLAKSSDPNLPSNLARQASSDMTPAVSATSSSSTAAQGAPGLSTAKASRDAPSLTKTDGRLSQSANTNDLATATSDPNIDSANQIRNSEATPAGEQMLAPGVAPVTALERLEALAAKRLTGGDAPAGGLFDADARLQTDLLEAVKASERVNELGDLVAACKF